MTKTRAAGKKCAEGSQSKAVYCPAQTVVYLKCSDGQERTGKAATCFDGKRGFGGPEEVWCGQSDCRES